MKSVGTSKSGDHGESSVSFDHERQSAGGGTSSYEIFNESNDNNLRSARSIRSQQLSRGTLRTFSERERQLHGRTGTDRLQEYYNERARTIFSEQNHNDEPLVEVSPEILAVRRSALRVYEPLTYTWVGHMNTLYRYGFYHTQQKKTHTHN